MPIATEGTLAAARDLLTTIRDAVAGALTTQPRVLNITGTLTTTAQQVDGTTDLGPYAQVRVQIGGTFSATVLLEVSNDGVTWLTRTLQRWDNSSSYFATGNSVLYGDIGGRYFRIRAQSIASGTVVVTLQYTAASATVAMNSVPLAAGSSTIGNVRAGSNVLATGTIAAVNAVVDGTTDLQNYASVRVQVTGVFVGTLLFESSVDGTTWQAQYLTYSTSNQQGSASTGNTIASGDLAGRYFRIRASAWTSGTATVSVMYTAAPRPTPANSIAINGSAIKAASTAATAADGALVVAASPNTPLPVGTNPLGTVGANNAAVTGSLAALNAAVDGVLDVSQYASVRIQLTGTYSATMSVEVSNDGTNWTGTNNGMSTSLDRVTSIASVGGYLFAVGGKFLRVRASAYTSGTVNVSLIYSSAPIPAPLAPMLAAGTNQVGSVTVGTAPTRQNAAATTGAAMGSYTWKGGAGAFIGAVVWNPTASPVYVRLYDKATAPVQASDVPVMTWACAAGANTKLELGAVLALFMNNGIQVTVTGGIGDTDTTVPGAGVKLLGQTG